MTINAVDPLKELLVTCRYVEVVNPRFVLNQQKKHRRGLLLGCTGAVRNVEGGRTGAQDGVRRRTVDVMQHDLPMRELEVPRDPAPIIRSLCPFSYEEISLICEKYGLPQAYFSPSVPSWSRRLGCKSEKAVMLSSLRNHLFLPLKP